MEVVATGRFEGLFTAVITYSVLNPYSCVLLALCIYAFCVTVTTNSDFPINSVNPKLFGMECNVCCQIQLNVLPFLPDES